MQFPQFSLNNRVVVENTEDRIERFFRVPVSWVYMLGKRSLSGGQGEHQDFIVGKVGYLTAFEAPAKLKRLGREVFGPDPGQLCRQVVTRDKRHLLAHADSNAPGTGAFAPELPPHGSHPP
jgi:hypothetical protein